MPSWLRERAYAPYRCWRARDEEARIVWLLWAKGGLEVFRERTNKEIAPEFIFANSKPFPEGDDVQILTEILIELIGQYDFGDLPFESVPEAKTGSGLICHVVKVRWIDGSRETFRYLTREQAQDAARFQFVDNMRETRTAFYAGPRINWRYILTLGGRK